MPTLVHDDPGRRRDQLERSHPEFAADNRFTKVRVLINNALVGVRALAAVTAKRTRPFHGVLDRSKIDDSGKPT